MATSRNNGLAHEHNFRGVGTGLIEILQQLLTKVKRAGTCGAKHQLHVLSGCCSQIFKPCFASLYRGIQMCKIYIKPRLFIRPLLIFIGAHETTSLSWFFCVMTKEQNQNQYRNFSSIGNIAQHIKIMSCQENE